MVDPRILGLQAGEYVNAEYAARGLDVPDEIAKRQRAIEREIGRAIEAEIEKLDAEDKALQEKEQKRKTVQEQRKRLRQALEKA